MVCFILKKSRKFDHRKAPPVRPTAARSRVCVLIISLESRPQRTTVHRDQGYLYPLGQ